MAVLSTILYIDEKPVGYEISRRGEAVLFTPARFTQQGCCPPQFSAAKQGEDYQIIEAIPGDVQKQALVALHQLEVGRLLE